MAHPRETCLSASCILRNSTQKLQGAVSSGSDLPYLLRNALCVEETKKEPSVLDGRAAALSQDACAAECKQRLACPDGGSDSKAAPLLLGSCLTPFSGNQTKGNGFKNVSQEVSAAETSQISCDLHEAFILFGQQKFARTRLEVDTTEKALEEEVQSLRSALKLSRQREESNFRAIQEMRMQLHLAYRILDSQRSDLSCAEVESNEHSP
jgi:hypothetical protein